MLVDLTGMCRDNPTGDPSLVFLSCTTRLGGHRSIRISTRPVGPRDYIALTPFLDEDPDRDAMFWEMRNQLRAAKGVATTLGYGPRYLHSIGQLHKGGPDTVVLLQMTADDGADLAIPGRPYGFATLVRAKAVGDFQALAAHERRLLNVHLGSNVNEALATLRALIEEALG